MNGKIAPQVLNQPEVIADTRRYNRFEMRARAKVAQTFTVAYTVSQADKIPVEIENTGYLSTSMHRVVYLVISDIWDMESGIGFGFVQYGGETRMVTRNQRGVWSIVRPS